MKNKQNIKKKLYKYTELLKSNQEFNNSVDNIGKHKTKLKRLNKLNKEQLNDNNIINIPGKTRAQIINNNIKNRLRK